MAMNVIFCTHTHKIGGSGRRAVQGTEVAPIKVGAGTWIGANVLILSGVEIGKGCVIAAGAVVNQDCEDNGMYCGVPANKIKDLEGDRWNHR